MNNLKIFISIVLLVNLASCKLTERIYINKDGSGIYEFEMDLKELNGGFDIGQKGTQSSQQKDTLLVFADVLKVKKDSILLLSIDQQNACKKLGKLKIKTSNNGSMITCILPFDNVNKLIDFKSAAKIVGGEKFLPNLKVEYSYSRKKFKRKVTVIETEKPPKKEYKDPSTYTIEYYFSRKIKSTTAKNAIISNHKKTLTIKNKLEDIIENPMLLDFEVDFK